MLILLSAIEVIFCELGQQKSVSRKETVIFASLNLLNLFIIDAGLYGLYCYFKAQPPSLSSLNPFLVE